MLGNIVDGVGESADVDLVGDGEYIAFLRLECHLPVLRPNLELCDVFLEANVVLVVVDLLVDYAAVSEESHLGVNTSCDVVDID